MGGKHGRYSKEKRMMIACIAALGIGMLCGGVGYLGGIHMNTATVQAGTKTEAKDAADPQGETSQDTGGKETWNRREKVTLHMLHYWGETDADASARYLKKILEEEFPKAFPNVQIIQETCDNETYKRKMKIQMASDEMPDIMFSYGAGFMENFVEAGKVLPLDDYLDDFYTDRMKADVQENFIFNGKRYGVCCSSWVGVLYCNRELLEKNGAEIPTTYEELLNVCKKLRSASIEPIALGMMNRWQGQQWINNFTIQLVGAAQYKKIAKGEISMDNPALEQAAELTRTLIQEDAFSDDMYHMVSGEAEEKFLNGDAAMIYIGSWFTDLAEKRLGENLEVAKMPEVPGAKYPDDYHGGGSNGWIVSANTEYPELAAEIVGWLSYRLSCYQPANLAFTIDPEDAEEKISAADQKILNLYKNKKEGGIAYDSLMTSKRAEEWLEACEDFFAGGGKWKVGSLSMN